LPAQDALKLVIGLINNGAGDVTINGETKPAGQALSDFLQTVTASPGTVRIEGDTDPATGKITQVVTFANGQTGRVTVDGNPDPATGKVNGVVTFANGQTGRITVDGNPDPATGKVNATVHYADGSTGHVQIDANTGPAQSGIDSFIQRNDGRRITIFTTVLGSGGLASAGRLAAGGPVRGPGTGTSDTAGLFALSNGEHVWTAREVARAGGHAAIERLRAAVAAGQIPRLASGGSIPSTVGTAPLLPVVPVGEVAPQEVTVNVNLDGRPFAALVETTIARRDRNTRRTVTAGSGATF
jgi:hypothetical protein